MLVGTHSESMSDFPVDEGNLSFSGYEEAASLFITQNTFTEVSTQEVNDAINFIGGLDDISFGDNVGTSGDLAKLSQN